MPITWDDFEKVEVRIGTVLEAKEFPEARKPAYKLAIDFGEEIGIKKSSAQITDLYTSEDLVNKQVIAVVNFPAKQIGTFWSECLVLGVSNEKGQVVLIQPDQQVRNGERIF